MKLIKRHNRRFFGKMRTVMISVLTLIVMSHSSALSLKAADKSRTKNQVNKNATMIVGPIKHRSAIGQPIIGRHSGVSVHGFAGIIYAISQPPRVESVPITVAIEDSIYEYQILASDANGDEIFFTVLDAPSGLTVNADGIVSWTPSQENVGLNDVQIAVYDDRSDSTLQTWSIEVSDQNNAPVVSGIPDISFPEDSTFTIDLDVYVTDVDNDSSEMTWTVDIIVDTTAVVTDIENGVSKSGSFGDLKDKSVFTQNIADEMENKSGVTDNSVTYRSRQTSARSAVMIQYSSDGEAIDSLTISIDSLSHVATFTTPANYFASDILVVFSATDPGGLSGSDSSTVNIISVNDAPVLAGIPDIVFNEDDSLLIHFEDWFDFVHDADNADSTLIWSISTSDSDSIFVLVQGDSVLFNAPEDWFAINRDTITVTVRDSAIESSIRVAVHVLPVNDAPSLSSLPDTLTFGFDSTLVIDISDLEIDIDDPDSLLKWHAEFKNHGDSLLFFNILGDSIIEITSGFEGIGEDTLMLTVTDTSGASDSTTIFIQVVPSVGVDDGFDALPEKFELFQNYPNPFNPTTTIMYALPVRSDITLRIYNLMGQEILKISHEDMSAGYHEQKWNGLNQSGREVASGIYIYRLKAGDFVETKKMLLLK